MTNPAPSSAFSYAEAFDRNIGWVTEAEQSLLRHKRVAIAGLGGVGGIHAITLARLGIGAFNIADFDQFELPNFNRQAGAMMSTLGKKKLPVMAGMVKDINPEAEVREFSDGVTDANLDDFLRGVDVYVDSLDFFVLDVRRKVFAKCRELGIPAITAGPIGMGTAMMVFMPNGMSFEDYFQFGDRPAWQQRIRFIAGLTPRLLHQSYLADKTRVDFASGRGPSVGLSCQMCAGLTAAQVLKILLKRGKVYAAPYYEQIDAYKNKWVRGYMPLGNANPFQRLKIFMIGLILGRMGKK